MEDDEKPTVPLSAAGGAAALAAYLESEGRVKHNNKRPSGRSAMEFYERSITDLMAMLVIVNKNLHTICQRMGLPHIGPILSADIEEKDRRRARHFRRQMMAKGRKRRKISKEKFDKLFPPAG